MTRNAGTRVAGHWVYRNIASPIGLAFVSYGLFWFSCTLPPSIYTSFIPERDYMFLNPGVILFYTICLFAFIAGFALTVWFSSPARQSPRTLNTRIAPIRFILVPLVAGICFAVFSDVKLLNSSPSLLLLLLSQQGQEVKNTVANELNANVTLAPLTLIGVMWWAFWRRQEVTLRKSQRRMVALVLTLAGLVVLASAVLTVSRSLLMDLFSGIAVLYVVRKGFENRITAAFLLRAVAGILVCVGLLFFSFSFLRGSNSLDSQIQLFFGYTIASYNRLAAMVDGALRFPTGGKGIYLSGFLAFNRTFNSLIPLHSMFNLPDPVNAFDAPFAAVARSGLDGTLVWPGAFGDIFSDLGWYSGLFLFAYGLLYGTVWKRLQHGSVIGIVLYPIFAFCVLFWFGGNILLGSDTAVLLVLALVLSFYEKLLTRPGTGPDQLASTRG